MNEEMLQIRDAIEAAIGISRSSFRAPPREKSTRPTLGGSLLWALGVLAITLEVIVLAVTLADGWDDHSAGTAIVANLISGVAVPAIGRVLYVNHRG